MKTIIWDFHGTLGERSYSLTITKLINELYPEYGIVREDVSRVLNGGYIYDKHDKPHSHLNEPEAWNAYMASFFANGFAELGLPNVEELGWRAVRRYAEPQGFTLYDDTHWGLQKLKDEGWRHIVLSNHVPELPQIIAAFSFGSLVERVITSARTGYEKPHPKMYEIALEEVGEHPCIMIGDNPMADYHGARACGIPSVQVRRGRSEGVEHYAKDMKALVTLIKTGYDEITRL